MRKSWAASSSGARKCERRIAGPTVGWPAKGNSRAGVKMRTRAVFTGSRGGMTKTVSDRLNSRAIACMRASSSPVESSTTASGLPASATSVNTSSVWKSRRIGGSLSWFGDEEARGADEFLLRGDECKLARPGFRRRRDDALDGRRGKRNRLARIVRAQPVRKEKPCDDLAGALDLDRMSWRAQPQQRAVLRDHEVDGVGGRIVDLKRGGEDDAPAARMQRGPGGASGAEGGGRGARSTAHPEK